jgi:hypothetical protein
VTNPDALWLDTLQRICGRAAHEVKGALNGVSVNLEVVRARSAKPNASAAAVNRYAETASEQLGAVITMTDALLALARPVREPVELTPLVRRICALIMPAATADNRRFEFEESDDLGVSSANGDAVRIAIGGSIVDAVDGSTHVICRTDGANGAPTIRLESCDGSVLTIRDEIVATATDAGIRIKAGTAGISITFPR